MSEKISVWQAEDGSIFRTELEAKKHDFGAPCFECPACKGKGHINGSPIREMRYDREATGFSGSMSPISTLQVVGYEKVACTVCAGHGLTKEKKKPVMKQVITGWE